MKLLGKIKHITRTGNVVLRGTEIPSLYSVAITADSRKIGVVKDVFGPVSKPYVLVKPNKKLGGKELSSLEGRNLYQPPKK